MTAIETFRICTACHSFVLSRVARFRPVHVGRVSFVYHSQGFMHWLHPNAEESLAFRHSENEKLFIPLQKQNLVLLNLNHLLVISIEALSTNSKASTQVCSLRCLSRTSVSWASRRRMALVVCLGRPNVPAPESIRVS